MKQKTAAIKFLRTKIAAGYVLILILIFSIPSFLLLYFSEDCKNNTYKQQ